jgi:hypothetical protein
MTERSHGKLRPSLPKAKDLPTVLPVSDPSTGRGARGHFAPGNRHGVDRAVRAQVKRWLGRGATDAQVEASLREARVAFKAELRTMPSKAPTVQRLMAAATRDGVLSAHLALKAVEHGLETPEGRAALELSMKLSARAERQSVTAWDLANRLSSRSTETQNPLLAAIEAAGTAAPEAEDVTAPPADVSTEGSGDE